MVHDDDEDDDDDDDGNGKKICYLSKQVDSITVKCSV